MIKGPERGGGTAADAGLLVHVLDVMPGGLGENAEIVGDPLPAADVIAMGHVLLDRDLATDRMPIDKAYGVLTAGGALIVHEAVFDDTRSQNVIGLLMSRNMLIESGGGRDYIAADCRG